MFYKLALAMLVLAIANYSSAFPFEYDIPTTTTTKSVMAFDSTRSSSTGTESEKTAAYEFSKESSVIEKTVNSTLERDDTILTSSSLTKAQLNKAWLDFFTAHTREFISQDEEILRKEKFEENFRQILEHNELADQGIYLYKLALNDFSDMSKDEFKNTMLGFKIPENFEWPKIKLNMSLLNLKGDVPSAFDWRNQPGMINSVKNQGSCGSCWAFAAVSSLETAYAMKYKSSLTFSEQLLVDCSSSYGNYGCQGGMPHHALDFVKKNGLIQSNLNPYTATYRQNRNCKTSTVFKVPTILDISSASEKELQALVVKYGSVSIAMDAENLSKYGSGIFTGPCSNAKKELDHAVNIVGYDATGSKPYWILRNSWSSSWGENGYFRLPMYKNACGLNYYKWVAVY